MENSKNVGFISVEGMISHSVALNIEGIIILSSLLWQSFSKSIKEAKHMWEVLKQFVYRCTYWYYYVSF